MSLLVLALATPSIVFATDSCTFKSFYKDSSYIGWIIAGLFAVVAAAAIWFTGGTASPIVVTIGTWIGNMMGLSGIAATNAGLALLGGGSIASGGFGMLGGTIVLTAALSFSTDIAIDFAAGKLLAEYNYSKFAEDSKTMTTLPIPKNDNGPKSYKAAIDILDDKINTEEPIASNFNQNAIMEAIVALNNTDDSSFFSKEINRIKKAKKETLFSVLCFLSNDYELAKRHAESAIEYANQENIKHTLPSFIIATSTLYEKNFDFNEDVNITSGHLF